MVDPFRHDDGSQQLHMEVHDGALTTAFEKFSIPFSAKRLSFPLIRSHSCFLGLHLRSMEKFNYSPVWCTWECCGKESQTERRRLQNERWYIVAACRKRHHTSHAKKTKLSCNALVNTCIHHSINTHTHTLSCSKHTFMHALCIAYQALCIIYRLLRTTALWNIFHVDIATHKLHIIHREIECMCGEFAKYEC